MGLRERADRILNGEKNARKKRTMLSIQDPATGEERRMFQAVDVRKEMGKMILVEDPATGEERWMVQKAEVKGDSRDLKDLLDASKVFLWSDGVCLLVMILGCGYMFLVRRRGKGRYSGVTF